MFLALGHYVTESSGHNSEYNWWFRKRPDLVRKYCTTGTGWNPGHYAYILDEDRKRRPPVIQETADRARSVLSPLRDLFAAVFFVAIGLTIDPAELLPMLPVASALAVVTAVTKVITGAYAARRDGAGRAGQRRAGTALIARGEFSLVIIGLAGTSVSTLGAVATPYVFILAILGPVLARFAR
jgi:Kef-type K+ transport system membrane component KefB